MSDNLKQLSDYELLSEDEIMSLLEQRNISIANNNLISKENLGSITTLNARHQMYLSLLNKGEIVEHPNGIVSQYGAINLAPTYFRGENRIFSGPCYSSLARKVAELDEVQHKAQIIIANLKVRVFEEFLMQLNMYREWDISDINVETIAQHYGFNTSHLDITDDFAVALFFACCKVNKLGKYRPFSEKDIDDYGKYGVIYRKDRLGQVDERGEAYSDIIQIGYQPFTRCHLQRGYYVKTNLENDLVSYDLIKTTGFKKQLFLRTTRLSKFIYEKMNQGKAIIDYELLDLANPIIKRIKNETRFTINELTTALDVLGLILNTDDFKELVRCQISVGDFKRKFNRSILDSINSKWSLSRYIEENKFYPTARLIKYPV